MAYFTQSGANAALFEGTPNAGIGYVAAVFPEAPPQNAYEIADVLGTTSAGSTLDASIVFLQQPIAAGTENAFVANVAATLAKYPGAARILAWSPASDMNGAVVATLSPGGMLTSSLTFYNDQSSTFTLTIPSFQQFQFQSASPPSFPYDSLVLSWTQNPPTFSPLAATVYSPLAIPFEGPNAFCVTFTISMSQVSLSAQRLGFAFAMPPPSATLATPELLLFAPLMNPDSGQTPLFTASFDPLDLYNAVKPQRTVLAFTGRNLEQATSPTTTFASSYSSPSGVPVTLTPVAPATALAGDVPATLVFSYLHYRNATPAIFMLIAGGDFVLSVPGETTTQQIMCGLQATEYLTFTPANAAAKVPGDRLRFVPGSPSYAPVFPFPLASPTAAPFDPLASPLNARWTAAYAMLRQPADGDATPVQIVAQPPGFELYWSGGTLNAQHPKLLGTVAPGKQIVASPTNPFPLVPYTNVDPTGGPGLMNAAQIAAFEAGILSTARTAALALDALPPSTMTEQYWFVTPSGYLVQAQYDANAGTATWTKIVLGMVDGVAIAFDDPDPALVAAFGTGSLMLVITNSLNTGNFENTLTIGDWTMSADIGRADAFGDYSNIVIVKGMPGALSDLVANPANWTNPATFAAPVTTAGGTADRSQRVRAGLVPDPSQLVNVAQWLQSYLAQAAAVTGPDAQYFTEFNALVTDPNWTGVLILRADITNIPPDIAGILAGITDYSEFNVHHLAIPLVPALLPLGPQPSPVSGLIYYNPFPGDPAQAVPTNPLVPYGFQVNSLKVTFENSAVQTFSSYAQVTLRSMLGSVASNAAYDSVVLTGTYQLVGGQPIYSLGSSSETPFALACAVLPEIDVTGVQMATLSADPTGSTVSAFSIVGYLDFAVVPGKVSTNDDQSVDVVDLFSYGAPAPGTPGGLAFQNLVLTMSFPTPPEPAPVTASFSLSSEALRFDLGTSTLRSAAGVDTGGATIRYYGNLVNELSLQLTGLLQTGSTPAQLGYLPVIGLIRGGKLGDAWNGLAFDVDLGSPGQLAAKAGLTSSLLLAWNPTGHTAGTWDAQIGLQLPGTAQGAPLISLQTVLSLSIGQVSLQFAFTSDGANKTFLLMLNEIALAFLGLLKFPPNGATSFYLFGHGESAQQQALGWYAQYTAGDKS